MVSTYEVVPSCQISVESTLNDNRASYRPPPSGQRSEMTIRWICPVVGYRKLRNAFKVRGQISLSVELDNQSEVGTAWWYERSRADVNIGDGRELY